MSAAFQRFAFKAKSVLCVVLISYTSIGLFGCGQNGLNLLTPAQQFRIPLAYNDALTQALRGTPFAGAYALDIYPTLQQFGLAMPTDTKKLSGKYSFVDGKFTITEFYVENNGQGATISMDNGKRVSTIRTNGGKIWKLPDDVRVVVNGTQPEGAEAYLAANAGLLDVAQTMDTELAASPSGPAVTPAQANAAISATAESPKSASSLDEPLRSVLLVIASIWYPLYGILPALVTVFSVAAVLQNALVLRFDGTWAANNAGNQLTVTIAGGKINKLVDPSSGQQLSITDSNLEKVEGNRVIWSVNASVLGQSASVNFEFDVQEMANGDLKGTLTTIGTSLARVPVTLTRL